MSAGGPAAQRCGGSGTWRAERDGLNISACVSHFQGRDGAATATLTIKCLMQILLFAGCTPAGTETRLHLSLSSIHAHSCHRAAVMPSVLTEN